MSGYRCCSQFNVTWAIAMPEETQLFHQDRDGYPDGPVAIYYFESIFFESLSEVKKNKLCRFKWYEKLGKKLENGSYDGSMNALVRSVVDVHYRPMDLFIEVGLIDHTSVMAASRYEIGHAIEPKERLTNENSLRQIFHYLVPSASFLVSFLAASLVYLLAAVLFALSIKRCFTGRPAGPASRTTKDFKMGFSSFMIRQLPGHLLLLRRSGVARVLLVTYLLFMFLVRTMLSMNIKTEKIIVDTSAIIHSEESLRNTKRLPCFPEAGQEEEVFSKSRKETLAHYVYYELNRENKTCFLLDEKELFKSDKKNFIERMFFIGPDTMMDRFTDYVRAYLEVDVFYNNQIFLAEVLRTYYLSKRVPKRVQKFLDECLVVQFTHGFIKKFLRDQPNFLPAAKNFKVYGSLEQYIADNTVVEDVELTQIGFLFRAYLVYLASLTIIWGGYLAIFFGAKLKKRRFNRESFRKAKKARLRRPPPGRINCIKARCRYNLAGNLQPIFIFLRRKCKVKLLSYIPSNPVQ